jgi:hypothetical protein
VLLTLLAEVTRNYVELRGFQRQLDVTRSLPEGGRSQHLCYGTDLSYAFPDSEGQNENTG